jgi:hypothetical protein
VIGVVAAYMERFGRPLHEVLETRFDVVAELIMAGVEMTKRIAPSPAADAFGSASDRAITGGLDLLRSLAIKPPSGRQQATGNRQ